MVQGIQILRVLGQLMYVLEFPSLDKNNVQQVSSTKYFKILSSYPGRKKGTTLFSNIF